MIAPVDFVRFWVKSFVSYACRIYILFVRHVGLWPMWPVRIWDFEGSAVCVILLTKLWI